MQQLTGFLLLLLLGRQQAPAQQAWPAGTPVVDDKLVARFIKQAPLLRQAAISRHFKQKARPPEKSLGPAPGDKLVTYSQAGDTLVFYQSGRTATLLRCHLTHAASLAQSVPFLASTKATLFAGKQEARNVLTVTEAARNGQYTLQLRFWGSQLQRLLFDVDTSSY